MSTVVENLTNASTTPAAEPKKRKWAVKKEEKGLHHFKTIGHSPAQVKKKTDLLAAFSKSKSLGKSEGVKVLFESSDIKGMASFLGGEKKKPRDAQTIAKELENTKTVEESVNVERSQRRDSVKAAGVRNDTSVAKAEDSIEDIQSMKMDFNIQVALKKVEQEKIILQLEVEKLREENARLQTYVNNYSQSTRDMIEWETEANREKSARIILHDYAKKLEVEVETLRRDLPSRKLKNVLMCQVAMWIVLVMLLFVILIRRFPDSIQEIL